MRSIKSRTRAPYDPAPSKWRYRWQRWMLTPGVKSALTYGLPLGALILAGGVWFAGEARRDTFTTQIDTLKSDIQNRPEFLVHAATVTGATDAIQADIDRVMQVTFPTSSFQLNLEDLRRRVVALNAVQEARVQLAAGGMLIIDVTPRTPVALWRDAGTLKLIDAEGIFIGVAPSRAARRDLPLIAGDGAHDQIDEALDLFATARPVAPDVRGLVRRGARRWDLVLAGGKRVMLPETGAQAAMDRLIALNAAQDVLKRDVAIVDLRNPKRPTLRLNPNAVSAIRGAIETKVDE